MDRIKIIGGQKLSGKVYIGGAKNATLPIMTAALLTEETLILSNVPHLADIITMANLLIGHGATITIDGTSLTSLSSSRTIILNAKNIDNFIAPYDIVRKMRASVWVLGPLLARFGEAKVSLPGGCAIGMRPIDMHLAAFEAMGASISLNDGYILATTNGKRLKAADIYFDKISVGATINVIMAATLAEGVTILHNAAKEPEVGDLIKCLIAMGALIENVSSEIIKITGVKQLGGAHHTIISDRIEAGTYAVAAGITGGAIELVNIDSNIIDNITEKLYNSGIDVDCSGSSIFISRNKKIKSINITTQAYPGFPTDMQAQFMALMTVGSDTSVISETIFENRFMHVPELNRMGANILLSGNTAIVKGRKKLVGAEVMATDLRASVSLVLAALIAEGETTINRVYHLDRGYERLEDKLTECGALVKRIK